MRAINHALTGAAIGLTVSQPAIVLPAALLSHLILDVIPHHGLGKLDEAGKQKALKSSWFKLSLQIDALLCLLLVALLALAQPENWLVAALCAFIATSPDFIWIRRYVAAKSNRTVRPSAVENFLARIQWFEKPIGALVEIAWFIAFVSIIWALVI